MPFLNFKKQFAGDVESGKKRQTIRTTRKRPIRPGETLYQYTGMRTSACRKLREDICRDIMPICMEMTLDGLFRVVVDSEELDEDDKEALAMADGFMNTDDFYSFFKNKLPFHGDIIFW